MNKEEIKRFFHKVQKELEKLQNENASFLFVGHEGNHFTIGGNPDNIAAQIVFAMIRYPVVRDIFMRCVEKYGILNAKFGDDVRNAKLDHLIEKIKTKKIVL